MLARVLDPVTAQQLVGMIRMNRGVRAIPQLFFIVHASGAAGSGVRQLNIQKHRVIKRKTVSSPVGPHHDQKNDRAGTAF